MGKYLYSGAVVCVGLGYPREILSVMFGAYKPMLLIKNSLSSFVPKF